MRTTDVQKAESGEVEEEGSLASSKDTTPPNNFTVHSINKVARIQHKTKIPEEHRTDELLPLAY
jgi:hypothetical protein